MNSYELTSEVNSFAESGRSVHVWGWLHVVKKDKALSTLVYGLSR